MIGLCFYLLPTDPNAQRVAPDQALPSQDGPQFPFRRRTRKRRIAYLTSLGLDPSMQPATLERYQRGEPINRVVVVQTPDERTPEPGV